MKNIKFFLAGWIILHWIIFFSLQSKAEEDIVQDQINPVNQQEEQKQEVEEQPKQPKDSKEVKENEQKIEQNQEQKIETEFGAVIVSKQDIVIGEKVRIAIELKEQNIQSVKGILQLQKNDGQYAQERMLSFKYEAGTKQWITYYKVESYDLEGDWHLQFIQIRKEAEKENLIEDEVKVPLVHIKNEAPRLDKELPKLEQLVIDEAKDGIVECRMGEAFNIRVKASDVESTVKEMRVILKGKEENSDITFLLDYNKRDMDWRKTYEITEALLAGTYRLAVEIVDAAGNKLIKESEYVVTVVEQNQEENEKKEEPKKEEPIQEEKQEHQEHQEKEQQEVLGDEKPPVVPISEKQEKQSKLQKETPKVHKERSNEKDEKVVSKKKEKVESKKEKQESKKKEEQGIQASNVFAIISGVFVLFLVLKSNKQWG
ncbi:transglycosylase [Bacillus clarus]|uniref:Transglycosylase n=1 Tax=Bacillus clarus TaxID=2338372 RepID=A0A090YSB6_9BACI|nr:hypothetical protein [Bacillus clarus]KFN01739.1 hypothetical protein DJ93_4101 [Bacillus clarus]RFT68484.1 transglycosylase [Bacillus clarus]